MLNEAQKNLIRKAYSVAAKSGNKTVKQNRIEVLAKQFAEYGVTYEDVRKIALNEDESPDFSKPATKKPPMMERQAPTEWTNSEAQQLRVMKEKGVANSEICKQLNKTAQQVSSKWYTLRKAAGKSKESEPKSAPAQAEPEKPIPAFDLTAVKQPISEHLDIFSTLQDIMRQAGAGYASVSITRQDGTKLRAEVRRSD